jgi:hypothetical protein
MQPPQLSGYLRAGSSQAAAVKLLEYTAAGAPLDLLPYVQCMHAAGCVVSAARWSRLKQPRSCWRFTRQQPAPWRRVSLVAAGVASPSSQRSPVHPEEQLHMPAVQLRLTLLSLQ